MPDTIDSGNVSEKLTNEASRRALTKLTSRRPSPPPNVRHFDTVEEVREEVDRVIARLVCTCTTLLSSHRRMIASFTEWRMPW